MATRSVLTAGFLVLLLMFPFACERTPQCPLCERVIHSHMQVSITEDSKKMKTCCPSCALTYQSQKTNVKIISVTDFLTDAPLDPEKAAYVVGSDISPCTQDPNVEKVMREQHSAMFACFDRCEPGVLSFSGNAKAEAFMKEHGGILMDFSHMKEAVLAKGGHIHDQQNH